MKRPSMHAGAPDCALVARMEGRQQSRTGELLQLDVASENLRRVLMEAAQQPVGAQEQVSEVLSALLATLRWAGRQTGGRAGLGVPIPARLPLPWCT